MHESEGGDDSEVTGGALPEGALRRLQLAALEAVADAIVFTDRAGAVLCANPAWETLTGYRRAEVLGRNMRILKSGVQTREFYTGLWRTILAGRVWQSELVNRRKDGTHYVEEETITPLLDGAGDVSHFIAVKRDISERARVDLALRESEERARRAAAELAKVFESSLDAICVFDEQGRFVQVSPACERLWGYRSEELVGISSFSLLVEEDVPKSVAATSKLMEDTELRSFQNRHLRKDGSVIHLMWTVSWSPTDRRFIGIARDVSEIERMRAAAADHTAEIEVARERAEAADRVKSAFLATMSHELRTPLNSIIGFTGILLKEMAGPLNAEQHRQLEIVRGSSHHLLALINDVLDLSKVEAGQLEVYRQPIDLRATIERVVVAIAPSAAGKGLALETQLPSELGAVSSDVRRVEQVLLNLLSNAVKFTERGRVTLMVEVSPVDVTIAVSDTGVGVAPAHLALLFEPFRQVDSGLARAHEGTGLGLAISRRLASLLGGSIAVESELGRGSTFRFVLPREIPP